MKSLVSLESSVNAATSKEKEAKKKMNQTNAKALVSMKRKVKASQKEHEVAFKQFQEVMPLEFLSFRLINFNRIPNHTIVQANNQTGKPVERPERRPPEFKNKSKTKMKALQLSAKVESL